MNLVGNENFQHSVDTHKKRNENYNLIYIYQMNENTREREKKTVRRVKPK